MDFSNHGHDPSDAQGLSSEQKETHWQPALKPNDANMAQVEQEVQQQSHLESEPEQAVNGIDAQQSTEPQPSDIHSSYSHHDDESDGQHESARLDPAWGIKRTDSAHILDGVHRTSSFPAPESMPSPEHTQSIFPPADQISESGHSFSQTKPDAEDEQETLHGAHDVEVALQEDVQAADSRDAQEQSRYEEGVPLIPQESEATQIQETEQPETRISNSLSAFDTAADDGDDDGDDGFFSQDATKSQLSVTDRPPFERKETSDVLNGLGVQDAVPDSPPPVESTSVAQSAVEKDFAAAFAAVDDEDMELAAAFSQSQQPEDDPWKAVMDDDDDFLIEDADDLLPDSDEEQDSAPAPLPAQSQPSQQHPPSRFFQRTNSNPYAPHQPTTAELTAFAPTTGVGLPRQAQNPMNPFQPAAQQPNITSRAESFVDQSKGGYKSPYDLPMDLAPKKRPQTQRVVPPSNVVPPPPRSSSMSTEKQLQSPFNPNPPTFNQLASAQPAGQLNGPPVNRAPPGAGKPVQSSPKRQGSGFFEELPIAPKPRVTPAPQRMPSFQTPGPSHPPPPPNVGITAGPPEIQQPLPQSQPLQQQNPYAALQPPAPSMQDPSTGLSSLPVQAPLAPVPPPASARYSPAPPSNQPAQRISPVPRYSPAPPASVPGPRYSPAPPAQANGHNRYVSQPVSNSTLPFQPRTSSPLAQHRKSVDDSAEQSQQRPGTYHSTSASLPQNPSFPAGANISSPPHYNDPVKQDIVPPKRSQTQSPSRQMMRPGAPARIAAPPNRPASAFGQLSPIRSQPPPNVLSSPRIAPQPKPAEELDYILPQDGTEHDPLQRFKGGPVFKYGFGGSVVTSFPIRTPRFSANASRPQIKASPGEVKTRKLESLIDMPEHIAKFPGPLKGKAKKKDVLTWLSTSISRFEQIMMTSPSKQLEEKIALWKIVRLLTENDGNIENPQAVQAASAILLPDVYATGEPTAAHFGVNDVSSGIYRPASFTAKTETVDPVGVERLRKTLLKGAREDAVWQAVDSRLWSHALLLASTLGKSVWKSVVSEFVKQEVKTIGNNADSLCALYEVLGGNTEESIDQLVPPSARAGLQMVSTVDTAGPARNALDGLDRWKETLCLILNNRTVEDQRALITLARLLTDYHRIEAAHICYLFARTVALPQMFSGIDDPAAMVVLLGADHKHAPSTFHLDTDAILLTEVFEWTVSTLSPAAPSVPMPHLASFKLQRAKELTDAGMKTEAQAYCDAILSGPGKNAKLSPYYHPLLMKETEELGNRLKQIPVQSASWMAKPSIEKVSGSVWNKFSSFVTGEDSDAESKGSARDAAEAGPFANVSGSPTLSRNTSQTDLHGSFPTSLQMTPGPAPTAAGSRYAPNGMGSARSSADMTRGRTSMEFQRSPPSTSHSSEPRNLYAPALQPQQSAYSPLGMSPPVSGYYSSPGFQSSPDPHMPSVAEESYPPSHRNSIAVAQEVPPANLADQVKNMLPIQPAFGGYTPSPQLSQETSPAPPNFSTFEAPSNEPGYGGYAPPEDTGYQPYVPEPDSDSDDKPQPPKKSFMDDEDDFPRISKSASTAPNAANDNDKTRKKANDEAAEAAFRAAAEADAQRAKDQAASKKQSGSWLGGWFAGKKNESLDAGSGKKDDGKTVHRVHLGESKMKLYYDKDKKKWINPDNPEASEKKALAPPPRASTGSAPPPMSTVGPPRSVSTPFSLPPGGISRSGTPMSQAVDTGSEGGDSRPGTGSGAAPFGGIAATLPPGTAQSLGLGAGTALPTPPGSSGGLAPTSSGPPSRPASALSNASGLDDLLGGPPTAGGTRRASGRQAGKGKKGRYVDVMAK